MNWDEARRKLTEILVTKVVDFTPEEMAWITADAKPNEIAYLDNCVIDFLERELAKNKARRRWLEAQEGEAIK